MFLLAIEGIAKSAIVTTKFISEQQFECRQFRHSLCVGTKYDMLSTAGQWHFWVQLRC